MTRPSPGLLLLSSLFVGAGALHLLRPLPFDSIVPGWAARLFGSERAVTVVSGVAELAGGLGLLHPATRPAARWGLLALLVAVFPANVGMALAPERYGLPAWVLWARLPLQPVLMGWVIWASRDAGDAAKM